MTVWPYSWWAAFLLAALFALGVFFISRAAQRLGSRLAAVVCWVSLGVVGALYQAKEAERIRVQAAFQHTLLAYRAGFPEGTTRGDVESRLSASNTRFWHECCTVRESPFDTVVRLESVPSKEWYCSEVSTMIRFLYWGKPALAAARADLGDRLREVRLSRRLGGCL